MYNLKGLVKLKLLVSKSKETAYVSVKNYITLLKDQVDLNLLATSEMILIIM